jgi:hypothetical protein
MTNQINPKLLELIDSVFDNVDDQKKALLFALAIFSDTVDILYSWGIMKDEEDEHKLRLALMERDIDTDSLQAKYRLRYPLFVNEVEEDVWDEFHKWLVKNPKLGHCKNKITTVTKEGKDAFKELQLIKDFDISRFKASVEQYYVVSGDYSKALPKFLVENAKGEYEGFVKEKNDVL